MVYYFLIGGISYWYFRRYRREDFEKEDWKFYLFLHGFRARFGFSGAFAFLTAEAVGAILAV